jgi:hypothetical protein
MCISLYTDKIHDQNPSKDTDLSFITQVLKVNNIKYEYYLAVIIWFASLRLHILRHSRYIPQACYIVTHMVLL